MIVLLILRLRNYFSVSLITFQRRDEDLIRFLPGDDGRVRRRRRRQKTLRWSDDEAETTTTKLFNLDLNLDENFSDYFPLIELRQRWEHKANPFDIVAALILPTVISKMKRT